MTTVRGWSCRATWTHYYDSVPIMQSLFLLLKCCVLIREAAKTNCIVFGLTDARIHDLPISKRALALTIIPPPLFNAKWTIFQLYWVMARTSYNSMSQPVSVLTPQCWVYWRRRSSKTLFYSFKVWPVWLKTNYLTCCPLLICRRHWHTSKGEQVRDMIYDQTSWPNYWPLYHWSDLM